MAERCDLQMIGIATVVCGFRLELRVGFPCRGEIRVVGEDQFAPLRGEAASATALSGLDDDRVPLRRARDGEGTARAEMPALVIKASHLLGVRETSGRLVDDQRVI